MRDDVDKWFFFYCSSETLLDIINLNQCDWLKKPDPIGWEKTLTCIYILAHLIITFVYVYACTCSMVPVYIVL
jgi:hypothetical protein